MKNLFNWEDFKSSKKTNESENYLNEGIHTYGPFIFNDNDKKDKLVKIYIDSIKGYSGWQNGYEYPKSDYKKAYTNAEKILKSKHNVTDEELHKLYVESNESVNNEDSKNSTEKIIESNSKKYTWDDVQDIVDDLSRKNIDDVVRLVKDYERGHSKKNQLIDGLEELGAKYSRKNDNKTANRITDLYLIFTKHLLESNETNESTTKLNESVSSINPMIQKEIDTFLAPIIKKYDMDVVEMEFSPETPEDILKIKIKFYVVITSGNKGTSVAFNKKDAEEIANFLSAKDIYGLVSSSKNFAKPSDVAYLKPIYFSDLKVLGNKMGMKDADFKNFATKIKELHELAPLFKYQEMVRNHKRFKLTSEIQKKKKTYDYTNVYEFTYESVKKLGGDSMHANEIGEFTVLAEVGNLSKIIFIFENNGFDLEIESESHFEELLNDM